MNPDDLSKMQGALAGSALSEYLTKMDVARQAMLGPYSQAQEIAKQLEERNSALWEASAALRFVEKERERFEEIRRIADPLKHIKEKIYASSWMEKFADQTAIYQPMMDRIAQLGSAASVVKEMQGKIGSAYSDMYLRAADASPVIQAINAINRSDVAGQAWQVPPAFSAALSSIDSIASSFEKLSRLSPVWAQAAELASSLDDVEGAALAANASSEEVRPNLLPRVSGLQGNSLGQRPTDLMTLVSLIIALAALILAVQQAISGGEWQEGVSKKLDAQSEVSRQQLKVLQSVSALLEKSAREEERRQNQVFVVKGRPALVRSSPYSGSKVLGELKPGESAKPIYDRGKWIEVEYFSPLTESYEVGWSLKKYFRRVYRAPGQSDLISD